tara:strand:+ start:114 stop:314 length:201 start_codon:yes stop_codon:yes gene_type:complete
MESDRDDQFWIVEYEGAAKGGYFIRNDLFKSIKRLEEQGLKVVGIRFDGTWNLELITALPSKEEVN